jgi:recombination protein RecA
MPSSATLRLQIEATLANRIPSALTPAQKVIRPVAQTGVTAVDEVLEGGLPVERDHPLALPVHHFATPGM